MIVFTAKSLPKYIEDGQVSGFGKRLDAARMSDEILIAEREHDTFVVHSEDDVNSKLIMIGEETWPDITEVSDEVTSRFLERVNRAARAMARPPVSLPFSWHKYSYENKVAFFAVPRQINPRVLRWIAESLPEGHVCFWQMTDRSNPIELQQHESDMIRAELAIEEFPEALTIAAEEFAKRTPKPKLLQPSIDLERVGTGALVQGRSYSDWLPLLTASQADILANDLSQPLKIRGIAGTGKTLILQLKALKELYRDIELTASSGVAEYPRVLFLTHSWAIAQQVEDALSKLDEGGHVSRIEVMPLTFLREWLQGSLPANLEVLGEDSLDGKYQQMRLIEEAVDHIHAETWVSYRNNVSQWVRESVESESGSEARLRLCWALIREFAEVFNLHQIKHGRDSLRKYLGLSREGWMVPLNETADREFAFAVNSYYVKRLIDEGQLTTDQLIDDFRRYLETYTWNAERAAKGYDVILVDEFHLFTDAERYILHLLTKDVDSVPRLVMAMDPSQSPFTLLTGLTEGEISRDSSRLLRGGETKAIDLTVAHRFSTSIFNFIQYLHDAMPNLVELGHDWVYEASPSISEKEAGGLPKVHFLARHSLVHEAVAGSFNMAKNISANNRIALIGVGKTDVDALKREIYSSGQPSNAYVVIEGKDDVELLRYSRRALVVTTAEYAAGLQFSHVVVVGTSEGVAEFGHGASAKRALYSQFYLAASRAEENLAIYVSSEDGEFNDVLNRAVRLGLIQE
ncbi:UvrD-helicase domain-containing protein [Streptomyces pseudogriseolus]|uniref:UvrD-helicase domain-containing protein n=1 Tax=Streptomyces pseudogriseolus TaxID=36817 RepID=UPI003FA1E685